MKELHLSITLPESLLVGREDKKYEVKTEKAEKALESGIHMQQFALDAPKSTWLQVHDYFMRSGAGSGVSLTQMDILRKMSDGSQPRQKNCI